MTTDLRISTRGMEGDKASVAIQDLSVLAGRLPPRALGLVVEWAALHRDELEVAWEKAGRNETLDPIDPLK